MLEAAVMALRAARAGMYVFPVQPGGKTPIRTPSGAFRWGENATTDPAEISDWFEKKCPTANYGIAAKPSGLLIVDCDEGKGPLPQAFKDAGDVSNGADAFVTLAEMHNAPFPISTLTVSTPSGGSHFFYRLPDTDLTMRNSSLITGWIDIRSGGGTYGGYVVGPGSVRDDGARYEVSHNAMPMIAPDWLVQLCAEKPKAAPPPRPTPSSRPYGDKPPKVDGLINNVRYAQEGNRSNALYWSACKYAEEGMHVSDAEADLTPAALDAGLDRGEILPTISSAYRKMGR